MEVASVSRDKRSAEHGRTRQGSASNAVRVAILAAIVVALCQCLLVQAQVAPRRPQVASNPNQASPPEEHESELPSQA
jgi:hypothetical protein